MRHRVRRLLAAILVLVGVLCIAAAFAASSSADAFYVSTGRYVSFTSLDELRWLATDTLASKASSPGLTLRAYQAACPAGRPLVSRQYEARGDSQAYTMKAIDVGQALCTMKIVSITEFAAQGDVYPVDVVLGSSGGASAEQYITRVFLRKVDGRLQILGGGQPQ